jgi:hypothetical protein
VLDDPAYNTDGFLWRDTCVSSTYLKRPIWSKQTYLHLATYVAGNIHFKNQVNAHRETIWYMLLLLTLTVFFQEIHEILQLPKRPICNKMSFFWP